MSNIAYTPKNAPATITKPGRVILCKNGECRLRLQFGLYFDGTNNNRELDMPSLSHSNLARLYNAAYKEPINGLNAIYIPGVGTPFPQIGEVVPHESGASMATMGAERIRRVASRLRAIALAALLPLPLAACLPKEPEPDPNGSFGSSVTAMDHDPSDTFVRNVYVNGTWVGEGGRGGKTVLGGITLPNRWRSGLTAVVKWERCDRFDEKHPVPDEQACRWTEKVVPIHQYDEVGRTWLHILQGDQILIIPSMLAPGHPDYPGPDLPTKDFFRNTSAEDATQRKDATP